MQYLSESQYKLVSEFNDRVRQSERSIQDRIDRQHNASGPQTPNPLHYIGTNETASKLSSAYGTAYGTRLETMFNPLATQGIITEEMGTPPQKQLFATVFNESPTHPTEIDNLLTTQSDKPGKKNYSTLQVESNIDYDQRLSSTKQKDSLVNYETKDPSRTSQYNQYAKPNRYDSLYKDTIAQSPSPFQKKSPYPVEENYTPGSGLKYKEEEEEYVAQQHSPNYYESKLDEYLKSQERSQYDSGHKRQHLQDESNSQLVYYLSDEKRRLKVPSIKLYEEGQVPLAFSNKTTPYGSRINEKPNSKDEKEDKMPPLSKSKKEKSKENTVIPERDRPVDIKKASPHPKKEKKEVRIQDVPVRDDIPKPSSKLGSVKSPGNATSNGSTSRPMKSILQGEPKRSNSVSSRRKKQGPIKMRSLSREPRENSKLQKSASKSLAKTVEVEPENEKAAVVKDILRKCRLGTLHEDTFVKVLENHMNSSPQLFEDLKSLLKK